MRPLVADLGLAGDSDDNDIIRDLEHSFGVSFGAEPLDCTTVGDIEARLLALYPASKTPGLCGSAMAFRRLRAAFPAARSIMHPATPLAGVIRRGMARDLARTLRRDGLDVPLSQPGRSSRMGCLMVLVGLFIGLSLWPPFGLFGLAIAAALIGGGIFLVARDRGDPVDTTFGMLAQDVAARNFAAFAARGADRRATAIRAAVRRIVCAEVGIDPRTVGCGTRLFG